MGIWTCTVCTLYGRYIRHKMLVYEGSVFEDTVGRVQIEDAEVVVPVQAKC